MAGIIRNDEVKIIWDEMYFGSHSLVLGYLREELHETRLKETENRNYRTYLTALEMHPP